MQDARQAGAEAMTRDGAFGPDGYSGISGVAARSLQSSSAIEKKNGLVISQATAQCVVRTNEPSTNCLHGTAVARFGCVIVDFSGAQAYRNGVKVPLTALEVKVLRCFIDNPARVISRHELLDTVWGYNTYPTTRTVDNQIMKLRKKLELDPKSPSHFVTVYGIGYKFVHEEFESGALARFQSSRDSVRRNTDWESERKGADLRDRILGHLSFVYELLTRSSP